MRTPKLGNIKPGTKPPQLETPEEFEQAVDGVLRDLKTSHTGLFHEARPRSAGRIAMAATLTKAETVSDGHRWVFQDVHPGGVAAAVGIESGDVLLAIDDQELVPPTAIPFRLGHSYMIDVRKPDGSIGLVDFAYLAGQAPEPFKTEWSGGPGINQHHKLVVTDFSLPTARVFTGSSNLSPTGERGNGDHLVMIEDPRVATAYAIEALRVFDHLHFRSRMEDALVRDKRGDPLTLARPTAISGKPPWFAAAYEPGHAAEADRRLFSR